MNTARIVGINLYCTRKFPTMQNTQTLLMTNKEHTAKVRAFHQVQMAAEKRIKQHGQPWTTQLGDVFKKSS
jgi:hypothetical protein